MNAKRNGHRAVQKFLDDDNTVRRLSDWDLKRVRAAFLRVSSEGTQDGSFDPSITATKILEPSTLTTILQDFDNRLKPSRSIGTIFALANFNVTVRKYLGLPVVPELCFYV